MHTERRAQTCGDLLTRTCIFSSRESGERIAGIINVTYCALSSSAQCSAMCSEPSAGLRSALAGYSTGRIPGGATHASWSCTCLMTRMPSLYTEPLFNNHVTAVLSTSDYCKHYHDSVGVSVDSTSESSVQRPGPSTLVKQKHSCVYCALYGACTVPTKDRIPLRG